MSRCNEQLRNTWNTAFFPYQNKEIAGALVDSYQLTPIKAVAVQGITKDWAAYIGPEDWSYDEIANRGGKLPEKVARALFDQALFDCGEYRL